MSGLSNCQCTSCSFEFNLKWGQNENRSKRQCMCCMQRWLLFFAPFSVDHVENRPKRECLCCLVGNTAPSQSPLGTISQTSCHLCQPCYKNLANTSSGNMQKKLPQDWFRLKTKQQKCSPFQTWIFQPNICNEEFLKIFLKVYPWWMIYGGRSGLLWLIFGLLCWISSSDKGNSALTPLLQSGQVWPK